MLGQKHYSLYSNAVRTAEGLQVRFPVKANIPGLGSYFDQFKKELAFSKLKQMKEPPKLFEDQREQVTFETMSHHHLNYLVLCNFLIRESCKGAQGKAPLERENYEKFVSILKGTLRVDDKPLPNEKYVLVSHLGSTISRVEVKRIISKEGKVKFGRFLEGIGGSANECLLLIQGLDPRDIEYHALFKASLFFTLLYHRLKEIASD